MKNQGITVLSEGEGLIAADIIFVHGLAGDALQTWTKGSTCWPGGFLSKDIPDARIMTWGYDAQIASIHSFSENSLFDQKKNLLMDVRGKRLTKMEVRRYNFQAWYLLM